MLDLMYLRKVSRPRRASSSVGDVGESKLLPLLVVDDSGGIELLLERWCRIGDEIESMLYADGMSFGEPLLWSWNFGVTFSGF